MRVWSIWQHWCRLALSDQADITANESVGAVFSSVARAWNAALWHRLSVSPTSYHGHQKHHITRFFVHWALRETGHKVASPACLQHEAAVTRPIHSCHQSTYTTQRTSQQETEGDAYDEVLAGQDSHAHSCRKKQM